MGVAFCHSGAIVHVASFPWVSKERTGGAGYFAFFVALGRALLAPFLRQLPFVYGVFPCTGS